MYCAWMRCMPFHSYVIQQPPAPGCEFGPHVQRLTETARRLFVTKITRGSLPGPLLRSSTFWTFTRIGCNHLRIAVRDSGLISMSDPKCVPVSSADMKAGLPWVPVDSPSAGWSADQARRSVAPRRYPISHLFVLGWKKCARPSSFSRAGVYPKPLTRTSPPEFSLHPEHK